MWLFFFAKNSFLKKLFFPIKKKFQHKEAIERKTKQSACVTRVKLRKTKKKRSKGNCLFLFIMTLFKASLLFLYTRKKRRNKIEWQRPKHQSNCRCICRVRIWIFCREDGERKRIDFTVEWDKNRIETINSSVLMCAMTNLMPYYTHSRDPW